MNHQDSNIECDIPFYLSSLPLYDPHQKPLTPLLPSPIYVLCTLLTLSLSAANAAPSCPTGPSLFKAVIATGALSSCADSAGSSAKLLTLVSGVKNRPGQK